MNASLKEHNGIVKGVVIEFTPSEWVVTDKALKAYGKDFQTPLADRLLIRKMYETDVLMGGKE